MANSTDPFAESVHGTNPQYLVEKITRLKIYNSRYWKESCFGLTSETIVDKAISLKYCGGTYGGSNKPSDFICLILKLLQLQPELDIVIEFIKNEDFKYLRVLGAFYMRLIGKPEDIFRHLEPLYEDYRKIAYRGMAGWSCKHMDEFIDSLLVDELVCDIALPHLPKRMKLEQLGILEERTSILDSELFNSDEPVVAADGINVFDPALIGVISAKIADEKKAIQPDKTVDNAEYINEYRKTDIRNTEEDKRDNVNDSGKYRSKRSQERSPNRGRDRSRERQGHDKSSSGTGRRRHDSEDREGRSRRARSRSADKRYKVINRDKSEDRMRSRSRGGDRRHDRAGTRKRVDRKDDRSRSRSRSPRSSRHSRRDRSQDRKGASRRYQVKDREYDRKESRGGTRRRDRDRSSSYDGRRSRTTRHRSRSSSESVDRQRSKSKKTSTDRRKRSRSSSSSSSSSRSSSSSSSRSRSRSQSQSQSRSRSKKAASESQLKSQLKSLPPSKDDDSRSYNDNTTDRREKEGKDDKEKEEDKEVEKEEENSILDDKAAAIKAAKAEKKFDKMFKTKKSSTVDGSTGGTAVKSHPEGSVEYWNQIREGLGIKKLKG